MNEIWKKIDGFEDYHINNFGQVKKVTSDKLNYKLKILKHYKKNTGYLFVDLCKNGKSYHKQIHRLLFETFIRKLKENEIVHHKDKNKENYNLNNLISMTKSEHHSFHNKGENNPMFRKNHSKKTLELMSENHADFSGENGPNSTLTEKNVIEIWKYLNEGILTQKEIGEKFGVNREAISKIKNKRTWNKYDHIFNDDNEYEEETVLINGKIYPTFEGIEKINKKKIPND